MLPRIKLSALASFCILSCFVTRGVAQDTSVPQPAVARLSPDQLDNLVAPIALYPDPLLGQVLAASTYPLEIVEAQQWFQQNGNLQGAQLIDAAKQQNWDPSVQALAAFPDVLHLLANDVRWTTDLGNAFLAQQPDVLAAVQRMRGRAQANGKLRSTPQQMVTTGTENGQSAIEIQPASPNMMFVPVYRPEYIWGQPAFGAYPAAWYPAGFNSGSGFDAGVLLNALFQGFTGWGGWGWVLNWLGHGLIGNGLLGNGLFGHGYSGSGLFVNSGFFNHYGFGGALAAGVGGRGSGGVGLGAWQHNPSHRMGVRYPNPTVAGRYNRAYPVTTARTSSFGNQGGYRNFSSGSSRVASNSFAGSYRSGSAGYSAPAQSFRGVYTAPARSSAPSYSASRSQNYAAPRSYAAPRQRYTAPRQSAPRSSPAPRSFSAPHSSGGRPHVSSGGGGHSRGGGHSSGGHSSGGHHKK